MMQLLIRMVVLGVVAPLSSSWASPIPGYCPAVNLYEVPVRPFDRMPIYDQGELSTCYAYTASQLIDFWRFKNDPAARDLTSPVWTALVHKVRMPLHWNPDNLDFSRMAWVFKSLEREGICRAEVVDRAIERLRNGNARMQEADLMSFFQELWDEYQNQASILGLNPGAYDLAYAKISSKPYYADRIENSLVESFRFIDGGSRGKRLQTLLARVMNECTGENLLKVSLPDWKSIGLGFASNRKIIHKMNEILERGSPLGLGYCSNLLDEGPGYRAFRFKPRILGVAFRQAKCGAHYSIVAGQRPRRDGSCEFLIRNTYGTGFWTDHFSCMCRSRDPSIAGFQDCKASQAERNNQQVVGCWISGQDLANNTYDLTWFE
jgi:hypothetical protein